MERRFKEKQLCYVNTGIFAYIAICIRENLSSIRSFAKSSSQAYKGFCVSPKDKQSINIGLLDLSLRIHATDQRICTAEKTSHALPVYSNSGLGPVSLHIVGLALQSMSSF